jgi:hypothetical protein
LCLDGEQLRSLKNPLKARYRAEPAALAARHAEDGLGSEEVSCSVQTGQTVTPWPACTPPAEEMQASPRATCCFSR